MDQETEQDLDLTPEEQAFFEKGGEVEETEDELGDGKTAESEQETAEQETGDTEEDQQESAKPPPGFVRLEALHEARAQNKELREHLEREAARIAQFESLREELNQIRQQRSREEQESEEARMARMQKEAEERYQEDPVGYLRDQNALLQQQIEETRRQQQSFLQAQQQSVQESAQMRQLTQHINTLEQQFRSQQPDYDEAFRFVQERRLRDMDAIGIASPEQKQQALYQEILGMSGRAIQEGRNPAELVYSLAKSWGFQPSSSQTEGLENAVQEPARTQPSKLDRIQRGQQMSTSLSDSGGAPKGGELSLADIERMSDEDFDKLWSELERTSQ